MYPRLMTNEQLTTTLEIAQTLGKGRFACVGDISCDVNVCISRFISHIPVLTQVPSFIQGGLQFLSQYTTLCSPTFVARPATLPTHLPSVTMMAVDILPTALPLEASQHFSTKFLPYLRSILSTYTGKDATSEEARLARRALERATVASEGELRLEWEWLRKPLVVWKDSVSPSSKGGKGKEAGVPTKKNVLKLGSGMVAPPAVRELCSRSDVRLVVGKYPNLAASYFRNWLTGVISE